MWLDILMGMGIGIVLCQLVMLPRIAKWRHLAKDHLDSLRQVDAERHEWQAMARSLERQLAERDKDKADTGAT